MSKYIAVHNASFILKNYDQKPSDIICPDADTLVNSAIKVLKEAETIYANATNCKEPL